MTYQPQPPPSGGGYSCPLCHVWVPLGQIHSCAQPMVAPPQPTITVNPLAELLALQRIALALERIAALLEGTDAEAQS